MNKPRLNQEVYFIDDYNVGGHLRVLKGKITGVYRPLPDKLTFIVEGSGTRVYREADAIHETIDELTEAIKTSIVDL